MLPTMKNTRNHIAAGVTVVALGALATVALASTDDTNPRSTPSVRSAATATPTATPAVHHRRGRGTDDAVAGHRRNDDAVAGHRRGRGSDDVGPDDHGRHGELEAGDDHGRHGELEAGDDHGGGHGGRGRGGHDD
jgi:hypothetical protein